MAMLCNTALILLAAVKPVIIGPVTALVRSII